MPLQETSDRVILTVRLTPNGRRDRIESVETDAAGRKFLKIRVSAPPVDGAANTALIRLLAKSLKLPKSAIRIQSGESSRLKRLAITGEASDIRQKLGL